MIIRALDSDGDWTFGKGLQNYKTDYDAMAENIVTRLKLWKTECFFALEDGVDWNNYMDIGTKTLLDADILRVILQSDGVIRIDTYESVIVNRGLTVDATILTVYGNVFLSEVL